MLQVHFLRAHQAVLPSQIAVVVASRALALLDLLAQKVAAWAAEVEAWEPLASSALVGPSVAGAACEQPVAAAWGALGKPIAAVEDQPASAPLAAPADARNRAPIDFARTPPKTIHR